jgi:hypothetical protein
MTPEEAAVSHRARDDWYAALDAEQALLPTEPACWSWPVLITD